MEKRFADAPLEDGATVVRQLQVSFLMPGELALPYDP